MKSMEKGLRGAVAPMVNSDYEFSQQDYRALTSTLLFQNAFIIRNGLAALGSELPKYPN
ncbi:hypothetical protein [Paracoccus liaowanqingii]|uniref:hypothetical protein n=1 Tax=Paracoccus liaowanqingii TaxID=2560053 RepID=UPI00143DFDE7|nr:hypothetical protein [Paracoccus liaowanqingii]